jgi:hypothetical protein
MLPDSHTIKMVGDDTSITIKEAVRDELRRYKAEDGLTYDEAIVRLLTEVDWLDADNKLVEEFDV